MTQDSGGRAQWRRRSDEARVRGGVSGDGHRSPAVELSLTRHANERLQQRGLRARDIDIVMGCGTEGPGGRVVLLERDAAREIAECKRRIQALERLRGCVVVCEEGMVVTCYHATGGAGRALRDGGKRRRRPGRSRQAMTVGGRPRDREALTDVVEDDGRALGRPADGGSADWRERG